MTFTIENFDNYINQHSKIFIYQLNSDPYAKQELNNNKKLNNYTNDKQININYKFNVMNMNMNISNNNVIAENEKYELYHLNISHLNSNYDWIDYNYNYSKYTHNNFISHLKKLYLDQSNELKKNVDKDKDIYKIISETCKIELDKGITNIETSGYISTTLLNQTKLYDGISNIIILTNPRIYNISSVKIRTRVKDNDSINPTFRNILWDLEFEECDNGSGYRILGLDNFIHISFVGLEEIFLDIEYDLEGIQDLSLGWLKFDKCYYNNIIKTNLDVHLYENEESYSVDIIDWIVKEVIDINQQEKMYNNVYDIDYNILNVLSGIAGVAYAN